MTESSTSIVSLLAVIALLVTTPGPSTLFALRAGAQRRPGSVLSMISGVVVGILMICGLIALISASVGLHRGPLIALQTLAGLAIAALGIRFLTRASGAPNKQGPAIDRPFRSGLAISAFNPKPALFYVAVLPGLAVQHTAILAFVAIVALLVGCHLMLASVSLAIYAGLGSVLGSRLSPSVLRWTDRVLGIVFLVFGGGLIYSGWAFMSSPK